MPAKSILSWTAAILAGGEGRRLGGIDKSAIVIEGRSILERQLSLLRPLTPHLLLVAGDRSRVPVSDIRSVIDRIAGAGALGGLYTALMEAPTEQVLVIGCDMPFLTAPLVEHLVELGRHADVVVPADAAGRHPLCASYTRRIAPILKARIERGELRILDALDGMNVREVGSAELAPFNRDGRLLLNINTPEDLARAR
jgi:molybdopterin-guanine dinucleotide biosynthesis protein A